MRRAVARLAAVVLIGLPTLAGAGWRSADRRQLDDDAVEAPYEDPGGSPSGETGGRTPDPEL